LHPEKNSKTDPSPDLRRCVMGFFDWLFGSRRKPEPQAPSTLEQRTDGADPRAVASIESLMREARELPIGSVREHAVAHFKVDMQGGYFLNGKPMSLEGVKKECARLGQIGGFVFYYRENPEEEPPEDAEAVIDAIAEARLPLSFASRDYDPEVKVAEYFLRAGA
jgi:hypothetical protein